MCVVLQVPGQELALREAMTWRSVDNCAIPPEVVFNDHHSAEWRKHVAVISAADADCDLGFDSLLFV